MTELATQAMSEQDARRLTERLRIAAVNYSDAKDKLMTLVQQAKDGNAHLTLGYDSWTDYLQEVLSGEPLRLARADRPEVARILSDEGMPNTVIAKTLGVTDMTVHRDLKAQSTNVESPEPHVVTRTDGKQYTTQPRPEPKPEPKREPSKELDIINDIRLYLNAIATSRQISTLSPAGKQHIIDALTNTITELKRN